MAKQIIDTETGKVTTVYSQKEKMHKLMEKTKVGALDNQGKPLSDFQRGKNSGRAEEIGKQLGRYKYSKTDEVGKAEIREQRSAIKAQKDAARAAYKASQTANKANKGGTK